MQKFLKLASLSSILFSKEQTIALKLQEQPYIILIPKSILQKYGIKVEEVFHSGKTRARQTAEIMRSRLNPEVELQEKSGLAPLDDVKEIANQIKECDKELLIAGHLPHLSKLTSLLVAGSESVSIVGFQQGGVVCLEKGEEGRRAVAWMLIPHILK